MNHPKNCKNLLIRMDKIGDLVVSLNADQHSSLKNESNCWLISRGLGWVMRAAEPSKNFMEWDKAFSISSFLKLIRLIRSLRFERAVVFQAPWFVGLALVLAGVPERIGRLSQWHSFLFFNRGVRQKRSQSDRHESQYNWDLISSALEPDLKPLPFPQLKATPTHEFSQLMAKKYCVVHPGMMGSALNWPPEYYVELTRSLSQKLQVVITGTVADRPWTEPIYTSLQNNQNIIWLQEKLKPEELLATLSRAQFVVAPSTGVIHLAAALGTPVAGIYSHRQKESAVRWGPLSHKKLVFSPSQEASQDLQGMRTVLPSLVFKAIEREFLK